MKTYAIMSGGILVYEYLAREIINELKATGVKRNGSSYIGKDFKIIYVTKAEQIRGLNNWTLIYGRGWYEKDSKFTDEVEQRYKMAKYLGEAT